MSRTILGLLAAAVLGFTVAAFALPPTEPPPPPPPGDPADCSPGYYKKHVSEWCTTCFAGDADYCELLRHQLSAEEGSTAVERASAKGEIDECYDALGGASATPCTED